MDFVVLVDSQDNEVGIMEKLEAHEKGLLHRAFSIFLFNSKGEMLLQQRALSKYHSPGLWTNACCSHPAPNETTLEAGKRRLQEELGLSTVLVEAFKFEYRAKFDNSLTEHELDHVLVGYTDDFPQLNLDEAQDYRWVRWADLLSEMVLYPEKFTVWFKLILTEHIEKLEKELCHASM
jgi:isopentenyl-diphosphate delta-isomerase